MNAAAWNEGMGRFLADPARVAARVMATVLAPPPPIDLLAWAEKNIRFGKESPLEGPYNPAAFPFFSRILEVLSPEHPASEVVLKKSAQLGGTVLAQIVVGAIMDQSPMPVFYVFPSDGNAKKWKRNKFKHLVAGSRQLTRIMQPEGARQGNSAMYWSRRDGRGFLQLAGANSPAQLSMESYPYAIHDDMAKWPADNGAGDPVGQADSRSKAFIATGGKIFRIGTPLVQPGCRITGLYDAGTREKYHVPCPHCGGMQPLEWPNMLACLDEAHPERAHFTCAHCGEKILQRHRDWMNQRGKWVAENPAAQTVSFHLWGAYSPLESWENIARAWLAAKGKPQAEQVFANDGIGEAYQTATAAPAWQKLAERAEASGLPRGVVPRGFPVLTVGCDCQIDRIEWQAVAWGPNAQRIVIDRGVIWHHVADEAARASLDQLVGRGFESAVGPLRRIDQLAIDGNAWTNDVHDWAKRHAQTKVIVVRGAKSDLAPPITRVKNERRPDGTVKPAQKRWYQVGVSAMKASLYAALNKDDPLAWGYVGFVEGLEDDFFIQLTSEVRKATHSRGGAVSYRWVPLPGTAQEGLDTHLYAWAAAFRAGVAAKSDEEWEKLIRKIDGDIGAAGPDLFSAALDRPAPPASRGEPPPNVVRPPPRPAASPRGEMYL